MSCFDGSTARAVAASMRPAVKISDDAGAALAAHVELCMRRVIQDAKKLAQHAKRTRVTNCDINDALRLHNLDILHGFSPKEPLHFVQQTPAAVNAAKKKAEVDARRAKKVGGKRKLLSDERCETLRLVDPSCFFFLEPEVNLYRISRNVTKHPPAQVKLATHWLAVGGIQPQIPQNPDRTALKKAAELDAMAGTVVVKKNVQTDFIRATGNRASEVFEKSNSSNGGVSLASLDSGKATTSSLEGKATSAVASSKEKSNISSSLQKQTKNAANETSHDVVCISDINEGEVGVQPLLAHSLSQELMLYFNNVTSTLASTGNTPSDVANRRFVLRSLRRDPGLQQLVPYLSRWISLRERPRPSWLLSALFVLVRAIDCMLNNSHLVLELYLHQLMPALLSCILNKRVCCRPTEDHWQLRSFAGTIVRNICAIYGGNYPRLQPRISKTLHNALVEKKKPLGTRYGAITTISSLGPLAVEQLLLPCFAKLSSSLSSACSSSNLLRAYEAQYCYTAAVAALGNYLRYRLVESGPKSKSFRSTGILQNTRWNRKLLESQPKARKYYIWQKSMNVGNSPTTEKKTASPRRRRSRSSSRSPNTKKKTPRKNKKSSSPKSKKKSSPKKKSSKRTTKEPLKAMSHGTWMIHDVGSKSGPDVQKRKISSLTKSAFQINSYLMNQSSIHLQDNTADCGLPSRLAEILPNSEDHTNPEELFTYSLANVSSWAGQIGQIFI